MPCQGFLSVRKRSKPTHFKASKRHPYLGAGELFGTKYGWHGSPSKQAKLFFDWQWLQAAMKSRQDAAPTKKMDFIAGKVAPSTMTR
jgi:hypothetical protein